MKKLLKLALLPALLFSLNLNKIEAKNGATVEIRNMSGVNLTTVKFRLSNKIGLGWRNDITFGKAQRRTGMSAASKNQYLKNQEIKVVAPMSNQYPSVKINSRHNGAVIKEIDVRYNIPGGRDKTKKYPTEVIIKKNERIVVTIYPESIETTIVSNAK